PKPQGTDQRVGDGALGLEGLPARTSRPGARYPGLGRRGPLRSMAVPEWPLAAVVPDPPGAARGERVPAGLVGGLPDRPGRGCAGARPAGRARLGLLPRVIPA